MANIELEITPAQGSGNELMEADEVRFKVISGEPTEQEISDYLTANATAATNLSYWKDDKSGMFIDLNFEFQQGKIVTFESTKA